uniref:NAD-dependent epimerase/dehydratase n=1 Tax=Variovorax paradoxus (strain S110) TaxID=543728 RepID=C5CLD4_VARPS
MKSDHFLHSPQPSARLKVALVAPTGRIGSEIAKEALRQGHEVIGVVRSNRAIPEGLEGITLKAVDISDTSAFAGVFKGAGVLASAYGAHGNDIGTVVDAAEFIIAAARAADTRRTIMVGGAGCLEVARGALLVDTPTFPLPIDRMHWHTTVRSVYSDQPTILTGRSSRRAAEIGPRGKLGNYKVAPKAQQTNVEGLSKISYPDYAEAFVAEIVQGKFIKEIMTIAYK